MRKHLLIPILVLICCAPHISNASLFYYNTISIANDTITIASEPDYPPYCIVNKEGNPEGFSVDLFKAAAKVVGIEVEIKVGVWDQIKQDLAEGRIDALPLVGRTSERENLYDFTMPYMRLHGAIFIRKGTKGIESIENLSDKSVAVMRGDNAEEFARRSKISNNIVTTHSFEEAFRLLDAGEVDAVIIQKVVGLELLKSMGLKKIVPLNVIIPEFRQDFCFAVQKGNEELLSRLNEGLSIVIANKTYDEIHLKWFGPNVNEHITIKELILATTKFLVPILIIFSFIAIVVLRRIVKQRTKRLQQEVLGHEITNSKLNNQQLLLEKMEKVSKVGGWDYLVETDKIIWTKGTYDIYGVSPDEFDPSDRETDIKFYYPDDEEILETAFQNTLKTGEPYDLELRFIDGKGLHKWIWTSGQAEYQNGKIVRVYGSIMDITESKLSEIALMDSEIKMREIYNSTNEAIFIHDASTGKILDCNDRTLEIYGYSLKEELINRSVGDISLNKHPYGENEAFIKIQKVIDIGTQTFEWIGKKKDGSTFWVEVSLRYIELNKEKRILAVVRDTSDRKKIEASLHEQEEIFNHFMEYSPIYVFFKDKDIRSVKLSKNYEQMLNKPIGELLGKSMDDLFPSNLAKKMIADDKKILSEGKTIVVDEEFNGRVYTTIKFPINIDGEPVYLAGYTIDITDRQRAEDELIELKNDLEQKVESRTKELNEQIQKLDKSQKAMLYMVEDLNSLTTELKSEREKLKVSNKELEAFSYSVSHDLRAPLRAIDGFSRIFIEDYAKLLDEEGVRLLNIIRENSQKMDKLITDLLGLSRVTRTQLTLSEIDMKGMARSMYHEVIGNEDEGRILITFNNMPKTFADTTLIRLVWQNLIGNAIKYSKPKDKIIIDIGGVSHEHENVYYVKDNGVGFNPEYKSKIFETFQRLHRADEFEGTGIGLSVVSRIISRHGGMVWAEGVEGEGATFWFTLPKSNES